MIDKNKKLFRWGPIDAALLSLAYSVIPSFDQMEDLLGVCWPQSVIIFDHDKATWIIEYEKVEKASFDFVEKNILPREKRKNYQTLWEEAVTELLKSQKLIQTINLNELSGEQLNQLFEQWNRVYLDFWKVGMTAELVNYELERRLKEILKPKFSDERDLNEAFAALSTPTKFSFYKEEEADLMRIVLMDEKDKKNALEKHQQKYHWIQNNYLESKVLNGEYFKNKIKHTTKGDAKKILEEIKEYGEKAKKAKKEYESKLHLSNYEIEIVNLLDEAIIFQDVRKKYNLEADYFLEFFLIEFSRRFGISVRDMKWLMPEEILGLSKGKDKMQLIEKRKNLTVLVWSKDKTEINIQNQASKINKELNKVEFEKSANLQGTVACTGKSRYFRGVAKIIKSPKEGDKLKKGEILVTTMTTPDYVFCMKHAGAIITDIGGVTCHAAVVSREFGVPCIVDTKYATQIIKDGDILELHNLRGVVKIVS